MAHKTFKVSIIIDDGSEETTENFYIKHFVDDFQPIFQKFKNLVFHRNPMANSAILKVYWIDAENDKILISCEEDFRLYIEQGAGKKIFFSVLSGPTQSQQEEEHDEAMEADESNERQKSDRRSRKSARDSARDEEKQKRTTKRLAEKMRSAEEKLRCEEERRSKHCSSEKHERKNAEKLERAKKRCEHIRQIIGSAIDPANLNTSSTSSSFNAGASTSTSSAQTSADPSLAVLHPSAETIRLLSSAIAGCLQPCNLINKILSDIIGMVPAPPSETQAPPQGPAAQTPGSTSMQEFFARTFLPPSAQTSSDQQQQTEVPKQNTATNTSDLNTPMSGHPSNHEIEALFKEAAKELEKMNEIVNSNKSMETSSGSLASSMSAITQVDRIMQSMGASNSTTTSTASDTTIVNAEEDNLDGTNSPRVEDEYKIVTPPKSMLRSRESSIEVHDVNSMMSDDSRDWTMLDRDQEEEEPSMDPSANGPITEGSLYPGLTARYADPPMSIAETQTPFFSMYTNAGETVGMTPEEIRASIQKSMEAVGELSEVVKNSIASAQESLKNVPQPAVAPQPAVNQKDSERSVSQPTLRLESIDNLLKALPQGPPSAPVEASSALIQAESRNEKPSMTTQTVQPQTVPTQTQTVSPPSVPKRTLILRPISDYAIPAPEVRQPTIFSPIGTLSATTQANLAASRMSTGAKKKSTQPPKVFDSNPKINDAVHQMMNMGFSNEGDWLTQLLINVDGDVHKAINFLTPQPKFKPQ